MRRSFIKVAEFLGASVSMLSAMQFAAARADSRHRIDFSRVGGKTRKTGTTYPHSSTRQRARYARQIAAGQLSFTA